MTRIFSFLLGALALASVCPVEAQTMIELKTAHFDLYTTNTEAQGQETLRILEGVRGFFEQTTSLIQPEAHPLRVIAFRSEQEYAPYRLQKTAFAHYLHSRRGDYIVLQDITPEHRRAAIHEYTHYIFRNAGLKLPIWLCEGTADLYSSLEILGTQSSFGGLIPSRYRSVARAELIPLASLFAADQSSDFYNDPQKVALFYGQSWALVHMLAFHPRYQPKFAGFLAALSQGTTSNDALERVFGVSVADVMTDLVQYLPKLGEHSTKVELHAVSYEQPTITNLSDVEAALAMADLLAAHRATAPQARARLEALTASNRLDPRAEELLSYLTAQAGRVAAR